MKEAIVAIISAVFNIAAIILKAVGFSGVADVLYQIMPEVNIIAVAVLWFFGYQERRAKSIVGGVLPNKGA